MEQVLRGAWADYLHGEDSLFKSRDERIGLGRLRATEADAATGEKVWLPPPDRSGRRRL
jgi:hypothetical protein